MTIRHHKRTLRSAIIRPTNRIKRNTTGKSCRIPSRPLRQKRSIRRSLRISQALLRNRRRPPRPLRRLSLTVKRLRLRHRLLITLLPGSQAGRRKGYRLTRRLAAGMPLTLKPGSRFRTRSSRPTPTRRPSNPPMSRCLSRPLREPRRPPIS